MARQGTNARMARSEDLSTYSASTADERFPHCLLYLDNTRQKLCKTIARLWKLCVKLSYNSPENPLTVT